METVYAKDESLVKKWELCRTKGGKNGDTVSSLAVTNKRLIYIKNNKFGASRVEEPIQCIRSISGNVTHGKKRTWVVVLSVILCITIVGAIIGFPMLKRENKRAKKGKYSIDVKMVQAMGRDSYTLNLGAYADAPEQKKGLFLRLFGKKQKNDMEIEFEPNIINDILETLGAIILENRK